VVADADGNPVAKDDASARYIEIAETDPDGTERRTYGEIESKEERAGGTHRDH
jgi:hypothetical protein